MAGFNRIEFGERLKKYRKDRGLSQENLAKTIEKMRLLLEDLKEENLYQTQSKYL